METAGNILSTLFDERFEKKAQGYSKLFDSWTDITLKNGIAAAADHSRIRELDRGILQIEMDHPGWKQILQTKQSKLLNDFRYRFPDLDISGISLILGKSEPCSKQRREPSGETDEPQQEEKCETTAELQTTEQVLLKKQPSKGYEDIKDDDFRETLKKLDQSITERERKTRH